ncbi:MAG: CDP-alcohol phosphatidyltransferase family protein [Patescibacteria group bacterium]|nr:CDP-alcohol phosphatidyltransferase family protein [Patescibacteria group bacterium]
MENVVFVLLVVVWSLLSLFAFGRVLQSRIVRDFFKRNSKLFHPNMISLYGALAALVAVILLLFRQYHISLIFYVVASVADGIDGKVARECKMETDLGKKLDPLCDKSRYGLIKICFVFVFACLAPVPTFIFLGVDAFGQIAREVIERRKRNGKGGFFSQSSVSSNWFGKVKTVATDVLVIYCFLMVMEPWVPNYANYVQFALIALAVLSIVFKVISFGRLLQLIHLRT